MRGSVLLRIRKTKTHSECFLRNAKTTPGVGLLVFWGQEMLLAHYSFSRALYAKTLQLNTESAPVFFLHNAKMTSRVTENYSWHAPKRLGYISGENTPRCFFCTDCFWCMRGGGGGGVLCMRGSVLCACDKNKNKNKNKSTTLGAFFA